MSRHILRRRRDATTRHRDASVGRVFVRRTRSICLTRKAPYMHTYVMFHGAAVYHRRDARVCVRALLLPLAGDAMKPGRALVLSETIVIYNVSRRLRLSRRHRAVSDRSIWEPAAAGFCVAHTRRYCAIRPRAAEKVLVQFLGYPLFRAKDLCLSCPKLASHFLKFVAYCSVILLHVAHNV